jgi:hypothetical protein
MDRAITGPWAPGYCDEMPTCGMIPWVMNWRLGQVVLSVVDALLRLLMWLLLASSQRLCEHAEKPGTGE